MGYKHVWCQPQPCPPFQPLLVPKSGAKTDENRVPETLLFFPIPGQAENISYQKLCLGTGISQSTCGCHCLTVRKASDVPLFILRPKPCTSGAKRDGVQNLNSRTKYTPQHSSSFCDAVLPVTTRWQWTVSEKGC